MNEFEIRFTENNRKRHVVNAEYERDKAHEKVEYATGRQRLEQDFREKNDLLKEDREQLMDMRQDKDTPRAYVNYRLARNRDETRLLRKKFEDAMFELKKEHTFWRTSAIAEHDAKIDALAQERRQIDAEYMEWLNNRKQADGTSETDNNEERIADHD